MPTTIDSAGIIFTDTSTITSANTFISKPASPSNGQVLSYNGSTWTGAALSASSAVAKAWVIFDGTTVVPTIKRAYNVTSVGRNTTGDFPHAAGAYQINFATGTFQTSAYVAIGSSRDSRDTNNNGWQTYLNGGTDYKSTMQIKVDTSDSGGWENSVETSWSFFE